MRLLKARFAWGASLVALLAPSVLHADEPSSLTARSPDGKNVITIAAGVAGSPLVLSVERAGHSILKPSPLAIELADKGSIVVGAKIADLQQGTTDETFALPWGKTSNVRNHYSWARAHLACAAGVQWLLEVRAFDDGVAFRYSFPQQEQLKDFVLAGESTEYHLAGDPTIHYMTCKNFRTDHENEYRRDQLAKLPPQTLLDLPLVAVWTDHSAVAVTEARLRDFTSLYLERPADGDSVALRSRLSPLPSRKGATLTGACVIGHTPHVSPWRVFMLADHPGRLIENNLLVCLNDPAMNADFSWVQPGKTTWHWWNGTVERGLPFKTGMNLATHKYYIDFCARHGIPYHAVVADVRPWHVQSKATFSPGPDTDILTPRPELELPRILEYAKEKRVGIRLWVHWKALDARLEEAFARYESWGIRGLMVDFLERDDQEMVNYCERVLTAAARHKLHIQFHGSYKPSGEQRTFPHLFNREGVLNLEYLKWSNNPAPPHNVGVAYTRLLAGPLDYHLGAFRAVSRAGFQIRGNNPQVLGTRCHHMAMYVVYENPMPMISDSPSAYEGQTGFEFVTSVPTTWDETRFVMGEPGEFIVVARRKKTDWYIGGMTDWTARPLDVPLDFLSPGKYDVTLYRDGSLDESAPNEIRRENSSARTGGLLRASLAPGGGFVAVLHPQ